MYLYVQAASAQDFFTSAVVGWARVRACESEPLELPHLRHGVPVHAFWGKQQPILWVDAAASARLGGSRSRADRGFAGRQWVCSKGWLTLAMPVVALRRRGSLCCGSSHEQCCSAGDGGAAWVPLAYFFIWTVFLFRSHFRAGKQIAVHLKFWRKPLSEWFCPRSGFICLSRKQAAWRPCMRVLQRRGLASQG